MNQINHDVLPKYTQRVKSKSGKVLLVIVLLIAFLVINAFVILNFFPQVVLSPKNMYLVAEYQAKNKLISQIGDFFNDGFVKDSLKTFSTPFSNTVDLSMKLKPEKFTGAMGQQVKQQLASINDLLSSSKITVSQGVDYKQEKMNEKISLNIKGNEMLNSEFSFDKDRLGISIPAIYNKYITLNTKDLTTVNEKLGQTGGLKKIPTPFDFMKAVKLDNKDLDKVVKDYSDFFANYISNNDVKFTKGAKVVTPEGNISCNQLTLKLEQARFKDLRIKLLEKISNDDRLLSLTAGNIVNILKVYDEAGVFDNLPVKGLPEEFKDINRVKEDIKKDIEKLKNETNESKNSSEFVMTLLVDRNFKVLERKVELSDKAEMGGLKSDNLTTLSFLDYKQPKSKGQNSQVEIKMEDHINNYAEGYKLNILEQPVVKGKPQSSTVVCEYYTAKDGKEVKPITLKFDIIKDNMVKNKHQSIKSDFDMNFTIGLGIVRGLRVTGKYASDMDRDAINKTLKSKTDIDADFKLTGTASQGDEEAGIVFNVNRQIKFDAPVNIPELNSSNSIDLNSASKEEVISAAQEIQKNVSDFYNKNKDLFK